MSGYPDEVACRNCGIVLKSEYLNFPDLDALDEVPNDTAWDGDRCIATVSCPLCGSPVPEDGFSM